MSRRPVRFLITCEHAGNRVPAKYRQHFRQAGATLESHRGWDPGALPLARAVARGLGAPLFCSTVSRLVVDLNRSIDHPKVFSEFTKSLEPREREQIAELYYMPFRAEVESTVRRCIKQGNRVVHLGIHTFTPVLHGVVRNADAAILYDPARRRERGAASWWLDTIQGLAPGLRVRRNYPYRGNSDGHTTALRQLFPEDCYLGFEFEANHRDFFENPPGWRRLAAIVRASIAGWAERL
ncbi:N-formylglutamate amidohydrolase [Candidatus Poribacteria bacterium]|nr:N-formylglutamate amidohydrolase [Candidatus Poribacteria bacterium]